MSLGSDEVMWLCVCNGSGGGGMELRVVQGVTKCANVLDDCGTQYS